MKKLKRIAFLTGLAAWLGAALIAQGQNLEEKVTVRKLNNGLTVVFAERHEVPTFSAVYGFKVGAVDEVRLIRPELAVLWVLLAAVGVVAWHRHRRSVGSPWPMVVGGILPLLVTIHGLSDPTRARYALPFLALTCGLVVVGLASLLGSQLAGAVVAAAAVGSLAIGLPQALRYRADDSPAIAALRKAAVDAAASGGPVAVERTLRSFADYLASIGELRSPLITDFSVEIGAVEPPRAATSVAVFPVCAFHPRCAEAIPECRNISPQLEDVGNRHQVACIRVKT